MQKKNSIFYRFGLSLGSLWPPFGLPSGSLWPPFGSFWLPLGSFFALFGSPVAAFDLLWLPYEPRNDLIASGGQISARSCQDFAKILPRTCRELAKNQPRTRSMNLKQTCLSNGKFFEATSFADRPFHKIAQNKKWGGGVPPWEASIE